MLQIEEEEIGCHPEKEVHTGELVGDITDND